MSVYKCFFLSPGHLVNIHDGGERERKLGLSSQVNYIVT